MHWRLAGMMLVALAVLAGASYAQIGIVNQSGPDDDPEDLITVIYEPTYLGAAACAQLLGGSVLYLNQDLYGGGMGGYGRGGGFGRGANGGYGGYGRGGGGRGGYGGFGGRGGNYGGGLGYGGDYGGYGGNNYGGYGGNGYGGDSGYGGYGGRGYGW